MKIKKLIAPFLILVMALLSFFTVILISNGDIPSYGYRTITNIEQNGPFMIYLSVGLLLASIVYFVLIALNLLGIACAINIVCDIVAVFIMVIGGIHSYVLPAITTFIAASILVSEFYTKGLYDELTSI